MRCVPSLCARSVASGAELSVLLYQAFHTVEMVATYWINRSPSSGMHHILSLLSVVWEVRGLTDVGYEFNLLKPTGYVMYQQFNIQQLYALPTLYLCVLYLSENKQRLVPLTA